MDPFLGVLWHVFGAWRFSLLGRIFVIFSPSFPPLRGPRFWGLSDGIEDPGMRPLDYADPLLLPGKCPAPELLDVLVGVVPLLLLCGHGDHLQGDDGHICGGGL